MALDRAGYRIVAVAGRSPQRSDDFVRRLP
ncbi:MAG: hypothetical protein M3R09_00865, partial [Actinomycetota bacterium]|nr:hypothetical protein [Actinomycetota bacterium]